jgi:type IV pilus assembly protein PilO
MASSGALSELARMPTQRKLLVFASIGLMAGGLYWKLAYKALEEDLETAQAAHDAAVQANKRLASDIPKFQELRAHMAKLQELIEKNQTALPNEAEVPAFFETLQRKIAAAGVLTGKWTKLNEEPIESFVKVPVEIELSGTFMQLKRFFASLIQRDGQLSRDPDDRGNQDHERIVSIENLALSSPTVKNREIILSAKFTAVTFRQEDRPTPAAGQPASGQGTPARSTPASPPASAPLPPPPLPSSTAPAAVKANVEGALDRGDARSRKAVEAGDAGPGAGSNRLKGGL